MWLGTHHCTGMLMDCFASPHVVGQCLQVVQLHGITVTVAVVAASGSLLTLHNIPRQLGLPGRGSW